MTDMTTAEAVELGAIDSKFYRHYFFPKAFRQESPEFHDEMWADMEDPSARFVAFKVFRDGAKTTNLRCYCSKRIAYGLSRTIMIVGKSQEAAAKSLEWLKKAVLFNDLWRDTFQLSQGSIWSATDIEIAHGSLGINIRVIAMGITGSTRGLNIDDYRPDLILVDDPCDEENTATPEQRTKIDNYFFGAIKNCLAPASDMPEAKMVLLQTPLDSEDLIEKCMRDKQWRTRSYSCFLDDGVTSRWHSRYPSEELLADKQAMIERGLLHLWMREKEVTVTSDVAKAWRLEWLTYHDIVPEGGQVYLGIDPTPPPKERGTDSDKMKKLDDAVIMAILLYKGKVFVLEYYTCKSPNPVEFINKIFEFVIRWRPQKIGFESVLFARTTKFYLEEEMIKRQHFLPILPIEDKRKKPDRLKQTLTGRLSARNISVRQSHTELIEQIGNYPFVKHDDLIDALSIAIMCINPHLESSDYIEGEYTVEKDDPHRINWREAP